MKTKVYFLIVVLVSLFTGCTPKTNKSSTAVLSHSDHITISGAFALGPLMQVWIAEYQKTHPYVKFELSIDGSAAGLNDLLAGRSDLAMISEEIPVEKKSLCWIEPVARLGVVPVMSGKNPYLKRILANGISEKDLSDLFQGKDMKTWGELAGTTPKDPVKILRRADSSGATSTFAKFLSVAPDQIKGTGVNGELELVNQVKNEPLSLSYCNYIYAFDPYKKEFLEDMKVVPINFPQKARQEAYGKIFDSYEHLQRAMWLGKFPNTLLRNLYVVSKGDPKTREMVDFMYWIITDGQRFIADNGYIELHSSEVQNIVDTMKAMIQ